MLQAKGEIRIPPIPLLVGWSGVRAWAREANKVRLLQKQTNQMSRRVIDPRNGRAHHNLS